jgi:tetratricopeptide (TPR) repeat protein
LDLEKRIRAKDKEFFADQQKVNVAINLFKKWLEIDPDYPKNYNCIGEIYLYQKNYDLAIKWFIKAVTANPDFRGFGVENKAYKNIRDMRNMSMDGHEEKINKTIDKFIDEFKKTNPESSKNLLLLNEAEIDRWVELDIIEIVRIVRNKNIGIILQNYPRRYIGTQGIGKFANPIIRNTAIRFKIPYVDNEKIFQEIIDRGGKTEDYFVVDGHCNSKGYKVMAANVYNKIIEEKIFGISRQKNE